MTSQSATTAAPENIPSPAPPAQWPRRIRFLQLGPVSLKIDMAMLAITALFVLIALAIAFWALGVSTTDRAGLGIWETLQVLAGQISGDPANRVAAILPAVIIALIGGASLALSGAIFQTLTRNPLGSPDIIGFTAGANTGALIFMLVLHQGSAGGTVGALIGSAVVGIVIYFLGMRGGTGGYRLIVVGIGVSAMLLAFNGYLIATATQQNAAAGAAFGMGNLRDMSMTDVLPVAVAMAVLLPLLIAMAPRMRMFELGADSAQSKGVNTGRTQLYLLLIGVGFAGATTAVAGPVAFVALVAPQLAARISPSPGIPLVTSAAVGAALLVSCDTIARTILAPQALPVGVVTTSIGGIYLLGLLIVQSRKAMS